MFIVDENGLAHYGTKGMKWGVRKDDSISSATAKMSKLRRPETDVVVKQKPGQFVKTSGGKRQTASTDAVTIAANRQRAKKSTTDSLTTKQLQTAVARMELEKKYHTLSKQSDRRTRGRKFADKVRTIPMSKIESAVNRIRKMAIPALG